MNGTLWFFVLAAAWAALALAFLAARRYVRPWFGAKPPPLRGEPVNFPAVPNVPVDVDEQRELEARVVEHEQRAIDTIDKARLRRTMRKNRAARRNLPTVKR